MKKTLSILFLSLLFVVDASTQTYSVNVGLNSNGQAGSFFSDSEIKNKLGLLIGSSATFDLSSFSKIKVSSSYFTNSSIYTNSWNSYKDKYQANFININPTYHINIFNDFSFFAGLDYILPISAKNQYLDSLDNVIDTYEVDNIGSGSFNVNFGFSYLLYYMIDFELGISILDYERFSGSTFMPYRLYFTVGYII
jgi:hypothetical protein